MFRIFALLLCSLIHAHALTIITSIKPVGSLVLKITDGTDHTVECMYEGQQSPHTSSLKISDLKKLKSANLVIWVGPEYELSSKKYFEGVDQNKLITLTRIPGIHLTHNRFDHHHEEHDHDCDCEDHKDGHMWMHPENAITILKNITSKMIVLDPTHKDIFEKNLEKAILEITEFSKNWISKLSHNHTPYLTFHDFTSYIDEAFGTQCMGVISPKFQHGGLNAKHIKELKNLVHEKGIQLFVREPQFSDAAIKKIATSGNVKIATIDYLGSTKPLSKTLFEDVLSEILQSFMKSV